MITVDRMSIEDFLHNSVTYHTRYDYENGGCHFDARDAIVELARYFANLCELLKLDKEQIGVLFQVAPHRIKEE